MNTHDLMALALDMAGMQEMPLDSAIYVSGEDIRRVLIGIDIGAGERARHAVPLHLARIPAVTVELGTGLVPDPAIIAAGLTGVRSERNSVMLSHALSRSPGEPKPW